MIIVVVVVVGQAIRQSHRQKSKRTRPARGRKKDSASVIKNHDMSCTIQDVEFVTTFHPVILDRTTDPISYREDAILGGRWTRIGLHFGVGSFWRFRFRRLCGSPANWS